MIKTSAFATPGFVYGIVLTEKNETFLVFAVFLSITSISLINLSSKYAHSSVISFSHFSTHTQRKTRSYHDGERVLAHGLVVESLGCVQRSGSRVQAELAQAERVGAAQQRERQFVLLVLIGGAQA